jgi:hypothetical protein
MSKGNCITQTTKAHWLRQLLYILLIIGFVAGIDGCTRAFYRDNADREVNDILNEKDKYPQWKIEQYHVYPDPRARFADPTDPDHPPMPPDDEAAYKLNPHPQAPGCAGVGNVAGTGYLEMIKAWDEQNRAALVAEAEASKKAAEQELVIGGPSDSRTGPLKGYFDEPLNAKRAGFLLSLDQAVELGVVNNRTYQDFRQQLYLTCLPVTAERFSFAYQWAAIEQAVREWAGPLSPAGSVNKWSLGSSVGFSKLFSTGALLTFNFANNTVFNFVGPNRFISASTINMNMVQPLLQGGGRAVTLEPLTESERNVLYGIRAYARFREQFYVSVAIGSSLPGSLPAAAGTTNVAAGPISVLAALGIASTDVSGGFVGYLSTLFREIDMAVDRKWVTDLEKAVRLFEGLQEGGQVSPLQVEQVKSTLLQAKNTVLNDNQNFTNALDQFKLVLGVPANLPLVLDDSSCRAITRQLDRYYEVIGDSDAAYKAIEQQEQLAPDKLREFLLRTYTADMLVRGTEFQKKLPPAWQEWRKLNNNEIKARLEKLGGERRNMLDLKTDIEMKGQTFTPEQTKALDDNEFQADVGALELILRQYEARPWEKLKVEQRPGERTKLFRLVAYSAEAVLVWARNDRFRRVGELWPVPVPTPLDDFDLLNSDVDTAQEVAVQAALTNRWDMMNARAQVVDAWRQIRVTANALMGVLNVGYNLEATTDPLGTKPFAFSTPRTVNQLTLNLQLPLNRLVQRNLYRAALLNFQSARRNLMSLEDSIAAQVRFDVRQLHLFAANYKIQQKVVQSLYSQVENALEVITAPVDPDALKQTGTSGAANAAALTQQYLTALSALNNGQTKMYDIWLSYQATRMELYQDLERLPLDNRGVWIDESGNAANSAGQTDGSQPLWQPRSGGASQPGSLPAANPGPGRGAVLGQPVFGEQRPAADAPSVAPIRVLPPS